MKYTKTTLNKIEQIFIDSEYTIRYEKGNFNSGYCLVENRKIIIINRFFDTEGRINVLIDILSSSIIFVDQLTPPSQLMYNAILKLISSGEIKREVV